MVNTKMNPNAPIVGTIDNFFSANNYKNFEGEDDGVTPEPLFLDVEGERSRASLKEFRQICDNAKRHLSGFLLPGFRLSKLPSRELYLPSLKFKNADNYNPENGSPVSQHWRGTLNPSPCDEGGSIELGEWVLCESGFLSIDHLISGDMSLTPLNLLGVNNRNKNKENKCGLSKGLFDHHSPLTYSVFTLRRSAFIFGNVEYGQLPLSSHSRRSSFISKIMQKYRTINTILGTQRYLEP